jgi:RimJ/RimL family protein N-acetyltransferase/catechol 2,3-dioxygenase-like lactoylglutathione lyase family enzyme
MHDHPELATERLVLRPLAPEHAAALYTIHTDAEAMRFWHDPPHASVERTRAAIDAYIAGTERAWVLQPRSGGDAIGLVYYLGNPGAPGMGYILHRRHWRQGLMSEAVRAALAYGFERLGLDRVELWIDARNVASQRLAERTGFKRRAAFCQKYPDDADAHEKLVYGLRIDDWRPGAVAASPPRIEAYSLQPVLAVPDVRATAEYYRDKLGFAIGFLFGEPPTYAGLWLGTWTATGANIHLAHSEALPPVHGISLYLNVGPAIDELHATYKARGVDMQGDVVQQPWGMREFAIRDCNGYLLRFGTPG